MSNDPFSLDMFGSSGLGLGVTAFGDFNPVAANDDDPDPTPPSPPLPARATDPASPLAPRKQGERLNFYLGEEDRGLALTWKERARLNVAAILTANEIERNDVPVTREH